MDTFLVKQVTEIAFHKGYLTGDVQPKAHTSTGPELKTEPRKVIVPS